MGVKNNNSRKDKKGISANKLPSVIAKLTAFLLIIVMATFYFPQAPFAAAMIGHELSSKETVINEDQIEPTVQTGSTEVKETVSQDESQKTAVEGDEANTATSVGKERNEGGRDLRNDPEYIAQLKTIYSEKDIERLNAPRKWFTMPDLVGLTEAQAQTVMHSIGLVGRIIYEDNGKEEGTCFKQEINPGMEWHSDASIFVWIQRTDKSKSEEPSGPALPEKSSTQPTQTVTPSETNNTQVIDTKTQQGESNENTAPNESNNETPQTTDPGNTSSSQSM